MVLHFHNKSFPHEAGEFSPRRVFPNHFISFFLTDFVYEYGGEMLRGARGDMLIIPSGETVYHGPTPEMTQGFVNDWAYIGGDEFITEAKRLGLPIGKPFSVGGERLLARFIDKADRERYFSEEGFELMIDLFIRELLIKLARQYKRSGEGFALSKITALRGEFAQDPKTGWTLSLMAERCGYSESRFSSLYKSVYGVSPMADLLNIRLENARLLLLYTSRTVSDIAYEVGFSTVFYFSSYFKKYFGISPKEYRLTMGKN